MTVLLHLRTAFLGFVASRVRSVRDADHIRGDLWGAISDAKRSALRRTSWRGGGRRNALSLVAPYGLGRRHRLAFALDLEIGPGEPCDHQVGRGRIGVAEFSRTDLA